MEPNNEPKWVGYVRQFYPKDQVGFTTRFIGQTLDNYVGKIRRALEQVGATKSIMMPGTPQRAARAMVDLEDVSRAIDAVHKAERVDNHETNSYSPPTA